MAKPLHFSTLVTYMRVQIKPVTSTYMPQYHNTLVQHSAE